MTKPDDSNKAQKFEPAHIAEEVFSSEQREDIWAILIATGILIFSVAFPDQIYQFFRSGLYLF